MNCRDCRYPLVSQRAPVPPGYRALKSRGLCSTCHMRAYRNGTIIDHPRVTRSREDVLEDYAFISRGGYPLNVIASRMGMTPAALERALQRASDDPRSPCYRGGAAA